MDEQIKHYERKLAFETDSWDLKTGLESGENIIVIDVRSAEAYHKEHIPGAMNIPRLEIDIENTNCIKRTALVVTYCDGIGCNA